MIGIYSVEHLAQAMYVVDDFLPQPWEQADDITQAIYTTWAEQVVESCREQAKALVKC